MLKSKVVELRTILSYMTRQKTVNLMESLGITVFRDEAKTTFRSVMDLMSELSLKWQDKSVSSAAMMQLEHDMMEQMNEEVATAIGLGEEWNDVQQRDLSQAAAGVRRRNFFLSLMSRFSKIQEVVNGQLDAEGYSLRENERTMQTLEKQVEQLKAAFEQFAVAIGDTGLLEDLKALVNTITSGVEWFNDLDDTMQTIIITLAEVTLGVKLLSAAMKGLGISGAIGAAGGLLGGWAVPIGNATRATRTLTTVTTGLTTVLKNLGKTAVGALGGPWVAGAIAAATVIGVVHREVSKTNAEMEENSRIAKDVFAEYNSLSSQLGLMKQGTDEYNRASQKLHDLQIDIAKNLPAVVNGLDSTGKSLEIDTELLNEMATACDSATEALDKQTKSLEERLAATKKEEQAHEKNIRGYEQDKQLLQDLVAKRENLRKSLEQQSKQGKDTSDLEKELAEADNLIAETAMEAGISREESARLTTGAMSNVIAKLDELITKENEEKEAAIQAQIDATEVAQAETAKRISSINDEIDALDRRQVWWQKTVRFISSLNPVRAFTATKENNWGTNPSWLEEKLTGHKKNSLVEDLADEMAEMDRLAEEELAIRREKRREASETMLGGSGGGTGGGSGSGTVKDYADAFKDAMEAIEESLTPANEAIADHNHNLEILRAKQQLLEDDSAGVLAGWEKEAGAIDNLNRQIKEHKQVQQDLHTNADTYREKLKQVNSIIAQEDARLSQGTISAEQHAKSTKVLVGEKKNLEKAIRDMSGAWWDEELAISGVQGKIQELSDTYSNLISWMEHMEAIGLLSTQQRLNYLGQVDISSFANQEDAWKYEEDLYSGNRKLLDEYMDALREAYDERMEMYDEEIEKNERHIDRYENRIEKIQEYYEKKIKAIQEEIDALDKLDDKDEKEEAEREHNNRIAELQEERHYHELRTGIEHLEAITDIDEQIAEENHNWEQQQTDWARDEQKDRLQEEIDNLREREKRRVEAIREEIEDLREKNKEIKEEMQEYYKKLQKMLDDHFLDMLTAISSTNPEMFDSGLDLMNSLARGIKAGKSDALQEIIDFLEDVQDAYNEVQSSTSYSGGSSGGGSHHGGSSGGGSSGGGSSSSSGDMPSWLDDDRWHAEGGIATRPTWGGFGEAGDEALLPIQLLEPMMGNAIIAALEKDSRVQVAIDYSRINNAMAGYNSLPDRIIVKLDDVDRLIKAIEDNRTIIEADSLVKIGEVNCEDSSDTRIFGDELGRRVRSQLMSKGRYRG